MQSGKCAGKGVLGNMAAEEGKELKHGRDVERRAVRKAATCVG